MSLYRRRILLGVAGGIAAYRSAELVRLLVKEQAEVRCVMTRSAQAFITPLTLEALSGEPVHDELFDLTAEREMGHIQLARWAELMVVAPATANVLARHAHGMADDLLTTILLARQGPVLMAPAMNQAMWSHPSTQANVALLRERGIHFIGPDCGALACGEHGPGRMCGLSELLAAMRMCLGSGRLRGERWVINAGPTWEAWDRVRVLTNRASGRLGYYLAEAAAAEGAETILVAGPGVPHSSLPMTRLDVESALDMHRACLHAAEGADVFVATAAVSDFRFSERMGGKHKRAGRQRMRVELVANPDIVADVARLPGRPGRVIAFAAECRDHVRSAQQKMLEKGVDAIVANDAERMGAEEASGWWIDERGVVELPAASKRHFAEQLLERIACMEDEA